MQYSGIKDFLSKGRDALAKGPVAMIFVEDEVEIDSTIRHHIEIGFKPVLVFMPAAFSLAKDTTDKVHRIDYEMTRPGALEDAVNAVIDAAPGLWMYYCYNAEYLFYPFCESRDVGEMLAFHTEERRDAMLAYVVDLYAGDLNQHGNAVSLEDSFIDRSGYYALARPDAANHNHPK